MTHQSSHSDELSAKGKQVVNLCVNCGQNQYELYPSPKDYVGGKHLTIFGWTILLYKEAGMVMPVDELCSDCLIDRSNANERERLEPALDDAYSKGYEDGLREL